MAVDRIKAYRTTLRKRRLEFDVFSDDEINDEDLLRLVNAVEAKRRSETTIYCAAVVRNLKEKRSKIGCFVVTTDNNDYVIGCIPEKCTEQPQIYVLLKALQLYGNSKEDLVVYNACTNVVGRVNDAIAGKPIDKDDGIQQIVEIAAKMGFHTHINATEKKLKITSINNTVSEFEKNTPSSRWMRNCERLALRNLHCLNEQIK